MRTSRLRLALAAALAFGAVCAGRASADTASCLAQARSDVKDCRSQCQDDFKSARFTCRGVDPACGTACLAGRQACFDDVDGILATGQLPNGGGPLAQDCTTGTDGCKAGLQTAKTACGAPCAPTDTVCDGCVDQAQVTAFVCRDTCREDWRKSATVQALAASCRTSFRSCVKSCPPAP
jgi:hypothetical protein